MQLPSRSLLLALALSAFAVPARAQNKLAAPPPAPTAATPPASLVAPAAFTLEPGDVISLSMANLPELSADALLISATGRVDLPKLGPLTIKGKTLEGARVAIENAYKSQLRRPKASIKLVSAQPRRATVVGAVARPGAVDLQPGWRVFDVLAAAGGLDGLAPEEVTATLKTLNGPPLALDLAQITRAPQSQSNARVEVGDVLSIAEIPLVNVTVNGDVGAPGPQSARVAPKLLDALARAGHIKLAPADTNVSLLREGHIVALDVAAATRDPGGAANITLRDGDLLSVQSVRLSVNVLSDAGLVKTPGNYTLQGRSNFTRALEAAGGTTAPADSIGATVRRAGQIIPVDVARAITDRDADIALQNGDILVFNPAIGPRVRVIGAVKTPAQTRFALGAKVLEALTRAGGLDLAPASTRITILRVLPDGRQLSLQVDAARLLGGDGASQNVTLQDGDVIWVRALATPSVAITGAVEIPGSMALEPGDGLAATLINSGGPNDSADLSRVVLERGGQASQIVNVAQVLQANAPDTKLEDGDVVRVPKNPRQFAFIDAVARPGIYAIATGATLTLRDAIARAGGLAPGARADDIVLFRRAPVTPQTPSGYSISHLNYGANNGKPNEAATFEVQPGDVIVVPAGADQPSKSAQAVTALNAFDAQSGFNF